MIVLAGILLGFAVSLIGPGGWRNTVGGVLLAFAMLLIAGAR